MLRHVAFVRTDISEERITSIIRMTRICKLGTMLAVSALQKKIVFLRSMLQLLVTANVIPSSPILVTLIEAIRSFKTLVFTSAAWHNIPEDSILLKEFCVLLQVSTAHMDLTGQVSL
jgi:hypothetical protein